MADKSVETQIAEMARDVSYIKSELIDLKKEIKDGYITKYQFQPLVERVKGIEEGNKWIVRTIAGTIIGVIVTAIITILGQ